MTEGLPRILLVEDDEVDRLAVERLFKKERLPYDLVTAGTLAEAIEAFRREAPDLALVDYRLPDGSGLEVQGSAGETPCIFITGSAELNVAVEAMKAGAYDFVVKDGRREYLQTLPHLIRSALERRRAEKALRESEERFRATFDLAAVGIAHTDPEGRFLTANRKFCEITGYSETELLGMNYVDITHPDDLEIDAEHKKRLLAGETDSFSMEKRYLRKNGTPVWVQLSSALRRSPSVESEYFITVVEDITERKAAEEALLESDYLKRKISGLEAPLRKLRHPRELAKTIEVLAYNASTSILILGETGTGKGMLARAIHELSDRRVGRFVDLNCAGLGGELLESELFGHERGAFTDAKNLKRGLIEVAHGGSLFLDEVAELSLAVQAKLLKVIAKRVFRRVGGTADIEADVRIMAATNADLEKLVEKGVFRKDLYFRLNVVPLTLPPLRRRRDDILPLAADFLEEFNRQFGKSVQGFTEAARGMLLKYHWPGNIRELKNIVERSVLLCEQDYIGAVDIDGSLKNLLHDSSLQGAELSLEEMERRHIEKVLKACEQNRTWAARILGISRVTLQKKIKLFGLTG